MRVLRTLILATASTVLAGCGSLGPLTDFGKSKGSPTTVMDSKTEVTAASGADFAINDSSAISGTAVSIPPGSLAINTAVTVGVGQDLLDEAIIQDLQLEGDQAATLAGPTVVIDSSELVDAAEPMQLAIPLAEGEMPLAPGTYAVLYRVRKASEQGQIYIGIITNVAHVGSVLKFEANHFGAFQAISLAAPIIEPREIKSLGTIATQSNETELAGLWASTCVDRTETVSGVERTESQRTSLKVSGDRLLVREVTHHDADCKNPISIFTVQATLGIGSINKLVPAAKDLDIAFDQIYLAPASAEVAGIWNEAMLCGYSGWIAREPKVFIDKCDDDLHDQQADDSQNQESPETAPPSDENNGDACNQDGGGPEVGGVYYQIFAIDGDNLFLGVDRDDETCTLYGDSADSRPIELGVKGGRDHFLRK